MAGKSKGERLLDELFKGLDRFLTDKRVHVLVGLYMLCDILPHIPDPIAKKIVDKLLGMLGLGD